MEDNKTEDEEYYNEQDRQGALIITDLSPKISEYAAKGYGPVAITLGFLQVGITVALGTGCDENALLLMFITLVKRVQLIMIKCTANYD